jgi:hypothetical protein
VLIFRPCADLSNILAGAVWPSWCHCTVSLPNKASGLSRANLENFRGAKWGFFRRHLRLSVRNAAVWKYKGCRACRKLVNKCFVTHSIFSESRLETAFRLCCNTVRRSPCEVISRFSAHSDGKLKIHSLKWNPNIH